MSLTDGDGYALGEFELPTTVKSDRPFVVVP